MRIFDFLYLEKYLLRRTVHFSNLSLINKLIALDRFHQFPFLKLSLI